MSEELEQEEIIIPSGQPDGTQLTEDEPMFYGTDQVFYSGWYLNTAYVNGQTDDTLTPIARKEYEEWFSPPSGSYGVWLDGKPVLAPLPSINYLEVNTAKAETLKNNAMATVQVISAKLAMNRKLTQAETDKMNAVLDYCDSIDALDLSTENVVWPELPA